jgi:glycosyltransferase involved in cell wall biosynthesis
MLKAAILGRLLTTALRVVCGTLFFPRGGSAYVARALTGGLAESGADLTLVAGSRRDLASLSDARVFYRDARVRLHEVDFTPALESPDPMAYEGPPGTAPLQPSFEDRPGAPDRAFAALDDDAYELQVAAWARELEAAGAAQADVLHLHHLTPLNEAAARVAPGVPIVSHLHGTELLMLEAIAAHPPGHWAHGERWRERLCRWAKASDRLVVAPGNRERAVELLGLSPRHFVVLPNGFDPKAFRPMDVDRPAIWRRTLVDQPRAWRPGQEPGAVHYGERELAAIDRGPVILYVGRFTEIKRLSLLLEAFADARSRMDPPATLILVGGHPGEWEGEHPADAIERLGLDDSAFLAGWHDQSELPQLLAAADLLVLPSARESFGQVIVEAMACGVPAIAAASLGPANIIRDGETGWLFDVDDRAALIDALVDAVNDPAQRARRARSGIVDVAERFTWPALGARLEGILGRSVARRRTGTPEGAGYRVPTAAGPAQGGVPAGAPGGGPATFS